MKLGQFQVRAKKIGVIVFLFILLGGVILAGQQASVYFAKASSCELNVESVSAPKDKTTANSAIVHFDTAKPTKGKVYYGVNNTLAFLADKDQNPAPSAGHDISLETFITPNTDYNYVVVVDDVFCDRSGKKCDPSKAGDCTTWSLRTLAADATGSIPSATISATVTNVPRLSPTRAATVSGTNLPSTIPQLTSPPATPGSGLSPFCQNVALNIGKNSSEASTWATLKQYDINNDGRIMGVDVVKCQKAGR